MYHCCSEILCFYSILLFKTIPQSFYLCCCVVNVVIREKNKCSYSCCMSLSYLCVFVLLLLLPVPTLLVLPEEAQATGKLIMQLLSYC